MNISTAVRPTMLLVLLGSAAMALPVPVQAGITSYMIIECDDNGCYEFNAPVNVNPPPGGGCQFPPCHWT